MGGYGSGQYWRYDSKDVTEDYSRIDVLWMKRNNSLVAGNSGSISWSRGGKKYSSIGYRSEVNAVRLIYKSRHNGEDWQEVDMRVQLTWSDCRFGGSRPYFICPGLGCGRRVQHLYSGNPYYVCRHCLHLAYKCQREQLYDRAARRAEKLRERAGDEFGIFGGPIFMKPKGMHWKTFYKLQAEETYYRRVSLSAISQRFNLDELRGYI